MSGPRHLFWSSIDPGGQRERWNPANEKETSGRCRGRRHLLGLWAMIAGGSKETLRGGVQERHLKATALTLPVLYDAKLIATVSAQVTLHDQNPIPVLNRVPALRDWRNHTLTDTADVVVNVGTSCGPCGQLQIRTPDTSSRWCSAAILTPTSPTWCCRQLSIRPPKESRITATWVMCSSTPSSIQRRPWRRRWVGFHITG